MKGKLARRPGSRAVTRSPSTHARRDAPRPRPVVAPADPAALNAVDLVRLQTLAGNEAVGQLLAQRRLSVQLQVAACPPPPPAAAPPAPHDDPKFVKVKGDVERVAVDQTKHAPPGKKAAEAAAGAVGPTNEVAGKAGAAQVDDMSRQKPGGFDRAGFIAAVHAAIARATPKNMEQVDDFDKSGKAAELKQDVVGKVGQGKDAAARGIKTASDAQPDTSKVAPKPVTPMPAETAGAPPGDVGAGRGMPSPVPAEQVSLDHTKCETDQQLEAGNVTRAQVQDSNEPDFKNAMADKDRADEHAKTAPEQFRQQETGVLAGAQGQANAAAAVGAAHMHQSRTSAFGHVASGKDDARAKNEAERARVATELEAIYSATKKDVDGILQGLDGKVSTAFDSGEKAARDAFENAYRTRKDAYFAKRYSGLGGALLWVEDKLTSPPPEVNGFIDEAKQLYLSRMETVIDAVADVVEQELTAATQRIQDGRRQVKDYVARQPKELQQVAQDAAGQFESRFAELDQAVTDKSSAIVDDLAQKYVAAAQAVDERCNAMREENKGLLDRARDAIAGMIQTIEQMRQMLAALGARLVAVAEKILQHPITFLGNLIGAIKQGLDQFVGNIARHLQEGLLGWLFGELADGGITMPETLDLKGILSLVLQVLGLTWMNFRARAVKLLGEEVVGMIEQGAGIFQKIAGIFETIKKEGLAGLWEMIQDKIGDLKATVIDQIKDFVITRVIVAGVTWILSLLNPASAFVKACKAIYDIIMFFVERGSQIMELVNAVLDNLGAIAAGNLSLAGNLVESVLAKGLPVAISFLASLLGLGGISEKIKEIINAVRAPIGKAIDWVLKTIVKPVARMAMKAIGWIKGKIKAGVDWVKKKGKAGVDWVKGKFAKKDDRGPTERKAALDSAMSAGQQTLTDPQASVGQVRRRLSTLKSTHRVKRLDLVVDSRSEGSQTVHIVGANSPTVHGPAVVKLQPVAQTADDVTAAGAPVPVPDDLTVPVALNDLVLCMISGRYTVFLVTALPVATDATPMLVLAKRGEPTTTIKVPPRYFREQYARQDKYRGLNFAAVAPLLADPLVSARGPASVASSGAKVTAAESLAIQGLGAAHGCHQCGTMTPGGTWVGDHIPPTALVEAGVMTGPSLLYPQCVACWRRQGPYVAMIIRVLEGGTR